MLLTHQPVLLNEAVSALQICPAGVYVDCTFGRGGHTRLILSKLGSRGRLIAFDKDLAAVNAAKSIKDPRFFILHQGFKTFAEQMDQLGYDYVDGVLMDLGLSSPQLDEAERGFSFRFDAPLDMRMNNSCGIPASLWLQHASQQEIATVIQSYGEERFAKQIAAAIVAYRITKPIMTTQQLADIVARTVKTREPNQHPATRTFQAIRIHINEELNELSLALPQILSCLRPGVGKIAVIAFHSLEDRIVKQFMKAHATADRFPIRLPIKASAISVAPLQLFKPIKASKAEIAANPRARSAILRVALRTTGAIDGAP